MKEEQIIKKFKQAKKDFIKACDKIEKHFNKKHKKAIDAAITKEELSKIKEDLKAMPECVGKVLLFKHIITKENNL